MTLQLDPEFVVALAPMAEAMKHVTLPAQGDVEGRRSMLHAGVPHESETLALDAGVARRAIADRIRVLVSL
jgi:hypothetical protein